MTSPSKEVYSNNPPFQTNLFGDIIKLKRCSKCKIQKPLDDFYKNCTRPDGRTVQCKECIRKDENERRHLALPPKQFVIPLAKVCSNPECRFANIAQPLENFGLNPTGKFGRHARCKDCSNTKKKEDYPDKYKEKALAAYYENHEENKAKLRKNNLRKYKVTREWYDNKKDEQGGKCAICGKEEETGWRGRLCIDHDHKCCGINKACDKCRRDLLCHNCNVTLGLLEKSGGEEWMTKAIAYLNKWKSVSE